MARVRCPTCAAVLVVDDLPRGQVCRCGACGQGLRIPAELLPPAETLAPPPQTGPQEDPAAACHPAQARRPRRRRKGRRQRQPASFGGTLRYYTGAIGVFGWILAGLTAVWLGGLVLALIWPDMEQGLLLAGSGLVMFGNVWIGFVAYRDSPVFGMLCFCTCLFTYAYIFMNLEETWKPAALTGLGFLVTLSGLVVGSLSPAA